MMDLNRQEVKNPVGILTDPLASDLPIEAWSGGKNIRFKNGRVSKAQGHSEVFPKIPQDGAPLYALPYLSQNVPYWFVGTQDKIYRTEGSSWVDFSRTGDAYSASDIFPWNGGFLSGIAVVNNGFDTPQTLRPNDNKFVDLLHWPTNTRAKVVRPFKNYLVAMNLTKNSVEMPTVIKWSSPADPGEVPFTWDENDPTNDAGESPLADTAGAIVDGKKLRDSFIIYKEDSVYSMRYIGGVYVFQFQQLYDDVGMLAPNCAAEFDGKHFVIGQGDVYVHNGVQKKSVIDGKMKTYLFNAIQGSVGSVFVVPDYNNMEMWICFQSSVQTGGNSGADQAIIWNWAEDTWTIRDLPNVVAATVGIVDPQDSDAWDVDNNSWDIDPVTWGAATYNPTKSKILMVSKQNKKVYVVGNTSLFDGSVFKSRVERTDLYGGDDLSIKHVTTVTPHITGTGMCDIYVGTSMKLDSAVEWEGPYKFDIAKDYKIDCRVAGRNLGFRFEFDSQGSWEFNGYTVETTKPRGKR